MQNKLQKFSIFVGGIAVLLAAAFGIKLKEDDKKMEAVKNETKKAAEDLSRVLETQRQMMAQRQDLLDNIAAGGAIEQKSSSTVKTVIPGKTVTQKVQVSGGSSKTTKSS